MTVFAEFFNTAGLTRNSKTGELEMALAESVDISEDGLQYVFHLRKSHWLNGDVLTSFDFAESWKSMLDPQFPTDTAYQLYPIKNALKAKCGEIALDQLGIQTPDPFSLIVELEHPVPYFLQLLSMPFFFPVPQKVVCSHPHWASNLEGYVCNGPFIPKSWKYADEIRVVKNVKYWQSKEVALESINLCMMNEQAEIQMFEEKQLDWAGSPLSNLPADALCDLKKDKKLCVNPFFATYFFRVNTAGSIERKKIL